MVRALLILLMVIALPAPHAFSREKLRVVAAESVYGNLAQAIGGDRVQVTSILTNPAQDPHLFEASPSVARAIAEAQMVIINGAGYDPWAVSLALASPSPSRVPLIVGNMMPGHPANPHLWYDPARIRLLAERLTGQFVALDPDGSAAYRAGLRRLRPRLDAVSARVAALRAKYAGTPITATEPVFGLMTNALGLQDRNMHFQIATMNGTEPSASDVAAMEADLRQRRVRALITNTQVSSPTATRLAGLARAAGVPVVGVTETEPAGQDYAQWMLSELDALAAALGRKPG
jgi:zinc/manganese transport system substrate-binding protein